MWETVVAQLQVACVGKKKPVRFHHFITSHDHRGPHVIQGLGKGAYYLHKVSRRKMQRR